MSYLNPGMRLSLPEICRGTRNLRHSNHVRYFSTRPGPNIGNPRHLYPQQQPTPDQGLVRALPSHVPSSFHDAVFTFQEALGTQRLRNVHSAWADLQARGGLAHLPIQAVRALVPQLWNALSHLNPDQSEASPAVLMKALHDVTDLAVFVSCRGHNGPLVECFRHAIKLGDYQLVRTAWSTLRFNIMEDGDAQGVKESHDDFARREASFLVLLSYAGTKDYGGAIKGHLDDHFFPPLLATQDRIISQLPLPYDETRSFLDVVDLASSIQREGVSKQVTARFVRGKNSDLIWSFYNAVMQGSRRKQPWSSLDGSAAFHITEAVQTFVISELVRCNRVELAQRVFNDILKLPGPPPAQILNIMLDGYGKKGDLMAARAIWTRLCERTTPDVVAYTTIIFALFQAHEVEEARKMWKEAQELYGDGKGLSIRTYNVVMHGLLINGLIADAEALRSKMDADGPSPDIITYNTILRYYWRHHDNDAFVRTLREISEVGLTPDVYTYTTILDALLQSDKKDAVTRLFSMMELMKVKPNAATYTTIVESILRQQGERNIRMALEFVEKMENDGIQTNEVTYTSMLAAVTRDESLSSATAQELHNSIASKMVQRGMEPNRVSRNYLIQAALNRDDGVEEAMEHWEAFTQSVDHVPHQTYFILLDGLIRRRRLREVEDVLRHMRESGFQPKGALDKLVQKAEKQLAFTTT